MWQKMILITKCLQNYIFILDIHVYLFLFHPLLKLKKKVQRAQLAIENYNVLGKANGLSASISWTSLFQFYAPS